MAKIFFDDMVFFGDVFIYQPYQPILNTLQLKKDESEWMYTGYGTAFDSGGLWIFDNIFPKNVIIFGVHANNRQKNIWESGDRPTYDINGSLDVAEEKLSNNFTKAKENFCLNLHYSRDNSYLFVGGKEIYKIKANNGSVNFPNQFYLENISSGFVAVESREVSLKGNVCYVSVDYNAIDKSDILNIHKYFMFKNNIE